MIANSSKKRKILHSLIWILGFIIFLVLTFVISWKYFEKQAEEEVSDTKPEYFPVVIITPNRSELVFTKDLEKYEKDNPNYSFLIPNGKEDLINKQLNDDQIRRNGKGTPRISAKTLAEGKQEIEFEIIGDGLFLSRYEANEKEIKPLMFKSSGPMFVIFPCGATFFFGFIGFFLLRFILWFVKRREKSELI